MAHLQTSLLNVTTADQSDRQSQLRALIEHAAELLPAQGPITVFIHHNTLHAFEDEPFESAVLRGAAAFGCHPYLAEERYRQELARGRIRREDIESALIEDLGDRADGLLGFLGTRFHLRQAMLEYPLLTGPAAELRWVVEETESLWKMRAETPPTVRSRLLAETRHWILREHRNGGKFWETGSGAGVHQVVGAILRRFDVDDIENWEEATWEAVTLHLLWALCRGGVEHGEPDAACQPPPVRLRDGLLTISGVDTDLWVQEVLIRFCAAYLDQGLAAWPLPLRDQGLFAAFGEYANQPSLMLPGWLQPLRQEMRRLTESQMSPLDSIDESLTILGIAPHDAAQFLQQSLLMLRGFAGMTWQVETRGDRVVRPIPHDSLVELLAVQLILERLALQFAARQALGFRGPLSELRSELASRTDREANNSDRHAFLVFHLAQLHGWSPETLARLSPGEWSRLLAEIEDFSGPARRRVLHLAYERRYREQALDALATHCRTLPPVSTNRAAFQVVCCIDDREESFRRHLEEVTPDCATFGAAGFFSVAMYYRGAADAHFTPLCPVIIRPQHYVSEDVAYSFQRAEQQRRQRRRAIGAVTHRVHLGSRTLSGGLLSAVLGPVASLPLVMRILFPRATAQFRRFFGELVRPPAVTQLELERTADPPGPQPAHLGFTVEEMSTIVARLLRDIGLTDGFARLVLITGHGSSSLNNPHQSAYDCGACGGAHGGPNARAWVQMANDPRVRMRLAESGLVIPADTWFVGAFHNTCDDSVTYFDLDRLPIGHREDFERAAAAIDEARRRNAHERCRRFESAPLNLSPEAALRHVQGRAEDLSQARPECGHATNALCFVGQRRWSRGLFLDRRAFLQSYDPRLDDERHTILERILQAVVPVCGGINLEYYFSIVDPQGYGCGTKLPHNITALLGVMNGAASDLRTGLPIQMVELHEPLRLLFVIETTPDAIRQIMERNPSIARMILGRWVQLATLNAETGRMELFQDGDFRPYQPQSQELPTVARSVEWYRGSRDHLGFAQVRKAGTL